MLLQRTDALPSSDHWLYELKLDGYRAIAGLLSSSATPSASQSRYSQAVRLADFILANVEPILAEWESFARSIWPHGATADPAEVRDEAEDILRATAVDMQSDQTAAQQAEKSKGASRPWDEGDGLDARLVSPRDGPGGVGLRFVGGRRRIPGSSGKRAPTLAGQRAGSGPPRRR